MNIRFLIVLLLFIQFLGAEFSGIIKTRYNYYTQEETAELLIYSKEHRINSIQIEYQGEILKKAPVIHEAPFLLSFPIDTFEIGTHELTCILYLKNSQLEKKVILQKLEPKFNEVKIDYYTQSLIVHDLPYIPFGFYNYWPVQPTLAEEEVVKGFNLMSPYQKIEDETLSDRRKYMDRCAELGMKVNYNLCSLGGGGGVGSNRLKLSDDEILKKLQKEVLEFKDHPALLSWYIADEPGLNRVDPNLLKRTYETIRELDPYHPVTIVFMHYEKAIQYHDAMDIVMADPYPIPQGSVTKAGTVIRKLHNDFYLQKPIWIVPQAFGGNEWWPREPTKQEIRIMTYLAMFEQATGVQYFIRSGMNAFPKSTTTWAETGAIALEMAHITPFLTAYDKVEQLTVSPENVMAKQWTKAGKQLIMVVNTKNEPVQFTLQLPDRTLDKQAKVLFENREETFRKGTLTSMLSAFGTVVYELHYQTFKEGIHPKNLTLDPSFETNPSVGVPSNCYVTIRGDKGATYFVDSRTAFHGEHSIRLTCPSEDNGAVLKFYRQRLQQNQTYTLSVWAKALADYKEDEDFEEKVSGFWNKIRHFFRNLFRKTTILKPEKRNILRMRIDDVSEEFPLTENWEKYFIQTKMKGTKENTKIQNPYLQMTGIGTAWVDLLELIPDLEMEETLQMDKQHIEVKLKSNHNRGKIFYRLFKEEEDSTFIEYEKPILITESVLLQARIVENEDILGEIQKEMYIHQAVGAKVTYRNTYAAKYDGGGDTGLVNAKFATTNYQNRNWQGFIAANLDVEIDLQKEKTISKVKIGCLHDTNAWVFLPKKITLYHSKDGKNYHLLTDYENPLPMQNPDRFIKRFELALEPLSLRYLKVVVHNIGTIPDWHRGSGSGAWLFVDEIEVE